MMESDYQIYVSNAQLGANLDYVKSTTETNRLLLGDIGQSRYQVPRASTTDNAKVIEAIVNTYDDFDFDPGQELELPGASQPESIILSQRPYAIYGYNILNAFRLSARLRGWTKSSDAISIRDVNDDAYMKRVAKGALSGEVKASTCWVKANIEDVELAYAALAHAKEHVLAKELTPQVAALAHSF